jgi:manganese-dependent inorganic pyrophosphatase
MNKIKSLDNVDMVLMFVVDILNEHAIFLTHEDEAKNISKESFGILTQGDTTILPGIVSRKKQIIPMLSKYNVIKNPADAGFLI